MNFAKKTVSCNYLARNVINIDERSRSINNFIIDLTFFFCRKFTKEFKVPEGVLKEQLQSSYSSEGILTINAPRKINAPEGAEVQEAMASASKAFTTDDGKNHSLKSKS